MGSVQSEPMKKEIHLLYLFFLIINMEFIYTLGYIMIQSY